MNPILFFVLALVSAIILPFSPSAKATTGERADIESIHYPLSIETVASGLAHPWSMVMLPKGDILISERNGVLQRVDNKGKVTAISGLPADLVYLGQGGLLGLALSPGFENDDTLYFAFSQKGSFSKAGTSIAKGTLRGNNLSDIEIIFESSPKLGGGRHFGGRLLIVDNYLYLSLGDRGQRDRAQQASDHIGTMIRINLDGTIPGDNPKFQLSNPNTHLNKPEVFSLGHRNIQGLALDNDGSTLWSHEHGPQGGDEINIIEAGINYGWPTVTYGVNYGIGTQIGVGTESKGLAQPIYYWVPSIAPSGLIMVGGKQFPKWRGNLLVGSLKFGLLVRLEIEDNQVTKEERLLHGKFGRIRDVMESPDGDLYLLTDEKNGKLLKISRRIAKKEQ